MRRVFKVIIHQSFFALFLFCSSVPLRFILSFLIFKALFMVFFNRRGRAECAECSRSLFTNLFYALFLCAAPCPLRFILPFLIFKALFMVFFNRRGRRVCRVFKGITTNLFLPYFSSAAPYLCGLYSPSLYSKPCSWFLPQRAQSESVQGHYSPIFFVLFLSAQLRVLCGLYLVHGFFNRRVRRVFKVIIPQSFLPYFSLQLRVLCGLYLVHGFLTAECAECSRSLFTNLFCLISLRSSASSAVYTLFMVFLTAECAECSRKLHSIPKNQCCSVFWDRIRCDCPGVALNAIDKTIRL